MKRKKTLALILAAALALALAACGGGNDAVGDQPTGASSENVEPAGTPEPEETPEAESGPDAVPLQFGDSIDNENFRMTFDSMELLDEYSYKTSEYSSTSLYVEDGYKLIVVKGHFENKSTAAIADSSFVYSAVVNDSYVVDGYDVRFHFIRDKYFEIDAYTDLDYVLYINIPEKLAAMFETAAFTIGFNDDLSSPTTVWNSDGTKTTETDRLYALTGGISPAGTADGANGEDSGNPEAADGIWAVNYYVDNFNQPTDEWYISANNYFSGTFSNSATTNSNLAAEVAVDYDDESGVRVAFFLYEYGRTLVKNSSSQYVDEYNITMRTADGADQQLTGTLYCGGDRIFVDNSCVEQVLTAMQGEGTISFYIEKADRATSTYLFSLEASNFASVYQNQIGG